MNEPNIPGIEESFAAIEREHASYDRLLQQVRSADLNTFFVASREVQRFLNPTVNPVYAEALVRSMSAQAFNLIASLERTSPIHAQIKSREISGAMVRVYGRLQGILGDNG